MELCSIASGSSGNCIYVGNDDTHILIDTGISKKRIEEGLNEVELSLSDIDGIFVTHEHSDHIQSLGVIQRKYNIPVYSSKETIESILNEKKLGKIDEDLFVPIEADTTFELGTLKINPFSVSHDAAKPYAYRVSDEKSSVAVATDMGYYDEYIVDNLKNLDALLVEANHDIRMLQLGRYPYILKQRILSNRGHLCNEMCGRLIDEILCPSLKSIFLGHLSQENNYPDLAYQSVKNEIDMSESTYKSRDFDIMVAHRDRPSKIVTV